MNNRFELRGQVVSYGITKNREWIEISTPDGEITAYLEGVYLKDLESDLADSCFVIATGYLQSYKYTDDVSVVATNVEVR